jgi:PTH2 family peptidyl-tRNA hydrolase
MKQVLVIRNDLKLPKGKLAAQAAHAAVEAAHKADASKYQKWRLDGQKKVVVKVDSEKELYMLLQQAKDQGIANALISDAGKTCIAPGTITCLGIGPDSEDVIDELTENLKLL